MRPQSCASAAPSRKPPARPIPTAATIGRLAASPTPATAAPVVTGTARGSAGAISGAGGMNPKVALFTDQLLNRLLWGAAEAMSLAAIQVLAVALFRAFRSMGT